MGDAAAASSNVDKPSLQQLNESTMEHVQNDAVSGSRTEQRYVVGTVDSLDAVVGGGKAVSDGVVREIRGLDAVRDAMGVVLVSEGLQVVSSKLGNFAGGDEEIVAYMKKLEAEEAETESDFTNLVNESELCVKEMRVEGSIIDVVGEGKMTNGGQSLGCNAGESRINVLRKCHKLTEAGAVAKESPIAERKMEKGQETTEYDASEHGSALADSTCGFNEDKAVVMEEKNNLVTELDTEVDAFDQEKASAGKRKRGRNNCSVRATTRTPAKERIGDDVCFICFDGGELVLCDRRGCPKAYHPSCVDRDEAFFQAKGLWTCGWHLCSICEKNAHFMCYTCPYSLCKGCTKDGKDAAILRVRGNKGFCKGCMKIVVLIENSQSKSMDDQIDFDDKSNWEYLFKDYYTDLKRKLSISSVEIAQAKRLLGGSGLLSGKQEEPESNNDEGCRLANKIDETNRSKRRKLNKQPISQSLVEINKVKSPCKGSDLSSGNEEHPEAQLDANISKSRSYKSTDNGEPKKVKRRKLRRLSKELSKEQDSSTAGVTTVMEHTSVSGHSEWASREIREFVMHMKDGDASALSQFDMQAVLLEYITKNKLRDPRQKSQIICDSRLETLFGKPRVGHFEMLKLLEAHFPTKGGDSQADDVKHRTDDIELDQSEVDEGGQGLTRGGIRHKISKKGNNKEPLSNRDDFAAIDTHNIGLIFLRRKLMEDLLEDVEKFHGKVAGTFVRIRISGTAQKQDMYRLVQIVGTRKAAEPYKVGSRKTDILLEIINLNKTEVISMDIVSNQVFTEEECKRLRQSIKCGLISRLTVGGILDKTMELQAVRVNDWMESETLRLTHLCDRASDLGRRKELRECVERLQLLRTPEERWRRQEEVPKIHADPNMDPIYESEEDDEETDLLTSSNSYSLRKSGTGQASPGSNFSPRDSWSNAMNTTEIISNKSEPATHTEIRDNSRTDGRDIDSTEHQTPKKLGSVDNSEIPGCSYAPSRSKSHFGVASVTLQASLKVDMSKADVKISETEKIWHYKDPSRKVQGPFSVVQLRKWSNLGYFPADLKIWRSVGAPDDSVLLTDALAGRFHKGLPLVDNTISAAGIHSPRQAMEGQDGDKTNSIQNDRHPNLHIKNQTSGIGPVEVPNLPTDGFSNLPCPNAKQSDASGAYLKGAPVSLSASYPGSDSDRVFQSSTESLPAPSAVVVDSCNQLVVSGTASVNSSLGSLPTSSSGKGILLHPASYQQTQVPAVTSEPHTDHSSGALPHGADTALPQKMEATTAPTGNFSNASASALSQPNVWGPPIQVGQPAMQPNVQWAAVPPQSNTYGPMPGNPNMGWAGPAPAGTHLNWGMVPGNMNPGWVVPPGNPGMTVQGPMLGNVNPGWVAQPGNPVVQGSVPGNANSGWVAPPVIPAVQGTVPGNANPGWVASSGNMALPFQGLLPGNGWTPACGNAGASGPGIPAGNLNQLGGSTTANEGKNGGQQSARRDKRFQGGDSGFGGENWSKQGGTSCSSRRFSRRETPCPYNQGGRCRKGAFCDYLHT